MNNAQKEELNNSLEELRKGIEDLKQQLYLEKQKNQKLMWLIGLTNSNGLIEKIEKE